MQEVLCELKKACGKIAQVGKDPWSRGYTDERGSCSSGTGWGDCVRLPFCSTFPPFPEGR